MTLHINLKKKLIPLLALLISGVVAAQDIYPSKPIKLIVPFPAGGGADTIARQLGNELSKNINTPVIIENKPGASGSIGNNMVAKAPADGYTLLLGITALIQIPSLYAKIPYEVKDLAPVSLIARSMDVFMVPRSSGITSFQDFAKKAKVESSKWSIASYGNATSSHLHGAQLNMKLGTSLMHIPYPGSGPEMMAMLAGQVDSAFIDATAVSPHLSSDKLNFLAVTGSRRHPSLPQVPTLGELGYLGFEANGWFAVLAPAATPKPIVQKLSQEIQKIVQSAPVLNKLQEMGLIPAGTSAEELAQVMDKDQKHWDSIAKASKISMD